MGKWATRPGTIFDRDECFTPPHLNVDTRTERGNDGNGMRVAKHRSQQLTNVTMQRPNARIVGCDSMRERAACEHHVA